MLSISCAIVGSSGLLVGTGAGVYTGLGSAAGTNARRCMEDDRMVLLAEKNSFQNTGRRFKSCKRQQPG